MAKPLKSQWDFGELFPPEATRKILSVTELTANVRRLLEREIGRVWVTGELSNFRAQSSGHVYFTLKDSGAQLSCVLFRGEPVAHRALLQDGQKVILQGELTVYEPRGQYQLRVLAVELQGVGALQLAFDKLKQKLNAEGLFAPERKRPLPRFPQRIGLVTSPTGAAIRDVLHVMQRRHPGVEIVLAPCRVQGEGAAEEVAAAIRRLNQWSASSDAQRLDLILLTRGGGSLEDLWAFNEEAVARAVFNSAVPVVSAVGHEIDFTISDFVADIRAATPSAAAEIITEGYVASRPFVAEAGDHLRQLVHDRLEREQEHLQHCLQLLARLHPRRRLEDRLQRLDDLQTTLLRCVQHRWRESHAAGLGLVQRLVRVKLSHLLARRCETWQRAQEQLSERMVQHLRDRRNKLTQFASRLRLLSPDHVLSRGYSVTMDAASGRVLRAAGEVVPGQRLKTRLKSGAIQSLVEDATGGD
ncbi:MAG: exodeoxyribonuclease VII large subunit [Limisphaerales bacterium]